jgi:hypothetical protein
MPDYSKGKIYKIVDNTNGHIYIGSTTQKLSQRLSEHRNDSNRKTCSSREIILNSNYAIVLIEEVKCENKDQLHRRERYYIETIQCVNKCIPSRTTKEYKQDNKEAISEYKKQYALANKEAISEYKKQYRQDNKEHILEYQKQYRQNKKLEKINITVE